MKSPDCCICAPHLHPADCHGKSGTHAKCREHLGLPCDHQYAPEPDVIEEMYAFVSEDETGEGIIAQFTPDHGWLPLVGADQARVDSLRPYAQATANTTGTPVKLLKFSTRTEVEVINPEEGP